MVNSLHSFYFLFAVFTNTSHSFKIENDWCSKKERLRKRKPFEIYETLMQRRGIGFDSFFVISERINASRLKWEKIASL